MSNIYVMNENYIETATQTYSSQNTVSPASNLLPTVRRSKVWRSDGYWEIISGNRTIIFREAVGVNLTATIATGNYQTDASFLAAIKTALEAAGAATYTVTRDSTTKKIKITSALDGGATIFQLITTNASFTAATILGFSTASDRTGAATYTADNLKIHMSEWIKWDCGVAVNPKVFALIGLRNTALKLSQNATIKLQGSTTDSWTSPEYESTLTYNEFGVAITSTNGLHASALRYWRLYLQDTQNAFGYLEISKIYLGDYITTTRGAAQFPLRTTLVDYGERVISKAGSTFNDQVALTELIDIAWAFLTKSEKEMFEDFMRDVGLGKSWFIIIDPSEAFSNDLERQLRLVKFESGASFTLNTPDNFSIDWTLREEI